MERQMALLLLMMSPAPTPSTLSTFGTMKSTEYATQSLLFCFVHAR